MLTELLHPDRKHDLENYLGRRSDRFLLRPSICKFTPEDSSAWLTKLRLASIPVAFEPAVFPDQVHLFDFDVVQYENRARVRKGVASTFLAERAEQSSGAGLSQLGKTFHMPKTRHLPLIMIGPGRIAPFRAFLQERRAISAKEKNWLFYGAQRENCDYAYKEDWEFSPRPSFDATRLRVGRAIKRNKIYRPAPRCRKRRPNLELDRRRRRPVFRFAVNARRMAKTSTLRSARSSRTRRQIRGIKRTVRGESRPTKTLQARRCIRSTSRL